MTGWTKEENEKALKHFGKKVRGFKTKPLDETIDDQRLIYCITFAKDPVAYFMEKTINFPKPIFGKMKNLRPDLVERIMEICEQSDKIKESDESNYKSSHC